MLRAIRKRGPDVKLLAVTGGRAISAKSQNGIFDDGILCFDCDQKIGKADKWFSETLDALHRLAEGAGAYKGLNAQIDSRLAIQFAVSVIYRASLSKRDDFTHISLGRYQDKAGEISTGAFDADFAVPLVLVNVLTSDWLDTRQFAFYPVRCSNGTEPYFVFTLSGIQFLVKFGRGSFDAAKKIPALDALRLKIGEAVSICAYPFEDSAEATYLTSLKAR